MQMIVWIYFGALFIIAASYGTALRKLESLVNWLSALPLLAAAVFAVFAVLLASQQPILFNRLRMSYGN